ncbi:TPA: phage tail assembly protein [Pseudomonas aeruginosa]|nr:phage tail assembly protein [Pseudomonas aeruginosa]HEJ2980535.1 phage tail assembly protein [Pseudomonas aeruginosa]
MTQENRLPGWLTLDADAALVRLSRPAQCNGVSVDTLTLRAPTVRDIRLAGKVAGDDAEERELQLFASLALVSRQDLEGLKLSDYQRLQGAYFRLVQDDTDDTFAYASTGEAPGH